MFNTKGKIGKKKLYDLSQHSLMVTNCTKEYNDQFAIQTLKNKRLVIKEKINQRSITFTVERICISEE